MTPQSQPAVGAESPEPGQPVYAGIDGGGTRTRLALTNGRGQLLGYAAGGSCSFTDHGLAKAQAELTGLWREAWRMAGMEPRPADALFMGLGSILAPQDAQINRELAVSAGLATAKSVFAENDVWNAHAGAFCGQPGILLISGTGSACFGRNARGGSWRTGGWGHLLNEWGSAHSLGQAALVATTRAADQRGRPTALTDLVCEELALRDVKEIFAKIHHEGVSRTAIAALAPRIVALAEQGDSVAQQILIQAADGLVEMVTTVTHKLQLPGPNLALTGGLITNAIRFRQLFLEALGRKLPDIKLVEDGLPPVLGAVLLAFEHGTGTVPAPSFRQMLQASSQPCQIL